MRAATRRLLSPLRRYPELLWRFGNYFIGVVRSTGIFTSSALSLQRRNDFSTAQARPDRANRNNGRGYSQATAR